MAHRYFTEQIADGQARVTGADAAHLARVLRVRPGDALILCDGRGTDYEAEVLAAAPEEIALRVLSSAPSKGEPDIRVEACVGMAKGERMDYAVQKCVELGASVIRPFYSENAVVKPKKTAEKADRYSRIAAEAAKQCGRGILPVVEQPVDFAQMLAAATACGRALFLYEEGGAPLRNSLGGARHIAIITGPEGGFTPREAEAARAAGCVHIGLGPRILRCETAPAAALAAVMTLTGNLE